MDQKLKTRLKRKMHIRKSVSGTSEKPRLSVYRSNNHIYAQLIDDINAKTIVSANDMSIKKGTNIEKATSVGSELAKSAKDAKIEKVVFDRNGFKFHGRVKALAEAARAGGLQF